jgi:hypothetical protein
MGGFGVFVRIACLSHPWRLAEIGVAVGEKKNRGQTCLCEYIMVTIMTGWSMS